MFGNQLAQALLERGFELIHILAAFINDRLERGVVHLLVDAHLDRVKVKIARGIHEIVADDLDRTPVLKLNKHASYARVLDIARGVARDDGAFFGEQLARFGRDDVLGRL
ncbi:hypothetical protein SDC9_190527 [bioreactor metagenome]|uniref:Uncharacterized protein n=1 Tax=bioreactor metagenome TaxID=1076179 RepID=A0A645HVB9_9ZZZZ